MAEISKRIILKNVIINFPKLFVPEAFKGQGARKYQATFNILKEDIVNVELLNKTIAEIKKEAGKDFKVLPTNICLVDGDLKDEDGELLKPLNKGYYVIKASSGEAKKPAVIDRSKRQLSIEEADMIKGGDIVNAAITISTCNLSGSQAYAKRITAYLNVVQFVKKGEFSFSNSVDLFEVIEDGVADLMGDGDNNVMVDFE